MGMPKKIPGFGAEPQVQKRVAFFLCPCMSAGCPSRKNELSRIYYFSTKSEKSTVLAALIADKRELLRVMDTSMAMLLMRTPQLREACVFLFEPVFQYRLRPHLLAALERGSNSL